MGYITGALSALALAAGIAYGLDQPKSLRDSITDTQSTLVRGLEKPKGYLGEGNLLEVLADAAHDIGQGNPTRAYTELDRIDIGLENTPYQNSKLSQSQYRDATTFVDYTKQELDEPWLLSEYLPSAMKTKGKAILGGLGLLTGLSLAGNMVKKKTISTSLQK